MFKFDIIIIHIGILKYPVKDSAERGLVFLKNTGFFVLFYIFYLGSRKKCTVSPRYWYTSVGQYQTILAFQYCLLLGVQPAFSKEHKNHILRQYWYTQYSSIHKYWDVPVAGT